MYHIKWKSLITGVEGEGVKGSFETLESAEQVVKSLNADWAGQLHHWVEMDIDDLLPGMDEGIKYGHPCVAPDLTKFEWVTNMLEGEALAWVQARPGWCVGVPEGTKQMSSQDITNQGLCGVYKPKSTCTHNHPFLEKDGKLYCTVCGEVSGHNFSGLPTEYAGKQTCCPNCQKGGYIERDGVDAHCLNCSFKWKELEMKPNHTYVDKTGSPIGMSWEEGIDLNQATMEEMLKYFSKGTQMPLSMIVFDDSGSLASYSKAEVLAALKGVVGTPLFDLVQDIIKGSQFFEDLLGQALPEQPLSDHAFVFQVKSDKVKWLCQKDGQVSHTSDLHEAAQFSEDVVVQMDASCVPYDGFGKFVGVSDVVFAMAQDVAAELNAEAAGDPDRDELQELFDGYVEAALWAETDPDTEKPLDDTCSADDLDDETESKMLEDCTKFYQANRHLIVQYEGEDNFEKAGKNFWLSRRGHGSNFLDEEVWDEETREALDKAAEGFGDVTLFVNDSGKVELM